MATSAHATPWWTPARGEAVAAAAYVLGAVGLAGEAAVHLQQFGDTFHAVRWIGPLFIANAVACVVAIVGLAYARTRTLAALAGVVTSVVALGGLVVSYGHGLFGWQEVGLRTAVVLVVISELGAVVFLTAALASRPQP
jgi:hypothetical protein